MAVPGVLRELLEHFELVSVSEDGDQCEDGGEYDFKGYLGVARDTSMGRKKGSWLTCTKVLHRCVEIAEWRKRTIESSPNMLIIYQALISPY
jgi:hypothetical protein